MLIVARFREAKSSGDGLFVLEKFNMPAKSKKQQQFMGAELARKRAGKKTKTSMSAKQLEEYAGTPRKGLPVKKKKK